MNASSYLLLIVFVAVGYILHPLVLPYVKDSLPQAAEEEVVAQKETKEDVSQPVVAAEPEKSEAPQVEEPVVVEPEVVVEEEEESEPEEVVAAEVRLSDEAVVELMQQSVRTGAVRAFKAGDAVRWERVSDVELDGELCEAGEVVIEQVTVFGKNPQRARAILREGKVAKWVWAVSGVAIE